MVNGEFKCLGSPQHLKGKFGNGYKLLIRLNDETSAEKLFEFIKIHFPDAINTETHKNLFEYVLPFKSTKISQIFGIIEKNRETLNLKDYSVTQTTLDQIFVNFAKSQSEEAFTDTQNEVEFTSFNNKRQDFTTNRPEELELKSSSNVSNTQLENVVLKDRTVEINEYIDQMSTSLFDPKYYEDMFPEPLAFT